MKEHVLGPAADIDTGEGRIFEIGRLSIGVFNIAGQFYALNNYCPHQAGPACESKLFDQIEAEVTSEGKVREYVEQEKCIIACPWHGIEFDARTGECLTKKEWKIKQYTVHVNEEKNLVLQLPS
jgi:nitrite reductase (NADH) small subunit